MHFPEFFDAMPSLDVPFVETVVSTRAVGLETRAAAMRRKRQLQTQRFDEISYEFTLRCRVQKETVAAGALSKQRRPAQVL